MLRAAPLALLLLLGTAAGEDARELGQRVKAARLAIKSVHAHVVVVNTVRNPVTSDGTPLQKEIDPKSLTSTREYDIAFQGNSFRFEHGGQVSILNENEFLSHNHSSLGPNVAVDVTPTSNGSNRVIDPRVWGISCNPFSVLANLKLADCLELANHTSDEVKTVDEDGRKLVVVSIEDADGRRLRYWVDSERDWNVIRSEAEGPTSEGKPRLHDRIEIRLKRVNGVWFPEQVAFTRSLGDVVLFDDVSQATELKINEPISAELFTMKGMKLPVGTYVHETTPNPGPPRFWDGEKTVTNPPVPTPNEKKRGGSSVMAIVVASIAIGLLLIGIYRVTRSRRD